MWLVKRVLSANGLVFFLFWRIRASVLNLRSCLLLLTEADRDEFGAVTTY